MKRITIYTDGSCSGNPGPGGWAALLLYEPEPGRAVEREVWGSEAHTTNNRMELTAVVEALAALNEPCVAHVHADSAYVVNAITARWIDAWRKRGWTTADKKPVKNQDLWEQLLAQLARHTVQFVKVKGHADNALNNRVDALAVAAMRTQSRSATPRPAPAEAAT